MKHETTLEIPKSRLERYNTLMAQGQLDYEANDIPRYSTVESWTADFGDGHEADIKVCSSSDGDPLWCEAVLFFHGSECSCTDVEDALDGPWELGHGSDTFIVNVAAAPE